MTGYIPRRFTHLWTITHPSTTRQYMARSRTPVDQKYDALITVLPSHPVISVIITVCCYCSWRSRLHCWRTRNRKRKNWKQLISRLWTRGHRLLVHVNRWGRPCDSDCYKVHWPDLDRETESGRTGSSSSAGYGLMDTDYWSTSAG